MNENIGAFFFSLLLSLFHRGRQILARRCLGRADYLALTAATERPLSPGGSLHCGSAPPASAPLSRNCEEHWGVFFTFCSFTAGHGPQQAFPQQPGASIPGGGRWEGGRGRPSPGGRRSASRHLLAAVAPAPV